MNITTEAGKKTGSRWKALLQTLPEESAGFAAQQVAFGLERDRLHQQLLAESAISTIDDHLMQCVRSPFRRMPLTVAEATLADALQAQLATTTDTALYSRRFIALSLYRPLHQIQQPQPERLEPWTVPLLAIAIRGQAMISVGDDEPTTLAAMGWVQDFAARTRQAGQAGQLPGGVTSWTELWLPMLGFEITALDYYSTNANMAPFVRFMGILRTEAFAVAPMPPDATPLRVLGTIPPRSAAPGKHRIALFCSSPSAHGHGLPHILWWISCYERSRFELILVLQETSSSALGIAQILARYPQLQEIVPIVIVRDGNLNQLQELQLDLLYNMDDLCQGRSEWPAYQRLAQKQITGFYTPATTGCTMMDHYITSPDLDPVVEGAFTEDVVLSQGIPFCLHYASYFGITPLLTRADLDIPDDAIVLSMGSSMTTKLRPEFADALAAILAQVPKAICVAMPFTKPKDRPHLVDLLTRSCLKAGVDPARIHFYTMANRSFLHGLIQFSDVFLDFFPFSGTNNVLDPLALSTPCVTLCPPVGYSRNRIAASILRSLSLDELIAPTIADYIKTMVDLCNAPEKRAALRPKMGQAALERSALCDGEAYVHRMMNVFATLLAGKPHA